MAIPNLTLKVAPFQFAEFKPLVYQQPVADTAIMRDSFNKREARRREANALAEDKLNTIKAIRGVLDPSEYSNFDKEFQELSDRAGELIALGDSGAAITLMNSAGRDMANDPKWQNKAQVKLQRDAWIDEAKKSGFSDITIRRMKKENPYYDDGTGTFKHAEYSRVIPFTDLFSIAVSKTHVDQNTTNNTRSGDSYGFSKDGQTVSSPIAKDKTIDPNVNFLYKSTYSNTNNISINELKEEDIYKTFQLLIKEPTINASLRQQFGDMQWLYNEANSVLNDPNSTDTQRTQAEQDMRTALDALEGENGFLILGDVNNEEVFDKWVTHMSKAYFKNAAYRDVSITTGRSSGMDYGGGSHRSSSGGGNGINLSDLSPKNSATSPSYIVQEKIRNIYNSLNLNTPSASMQEIVSK